MRRLAVPLAMAVLVAGLLAYLREPSWLASVESGFGAWETTEDGRSFRWASGRASFFVRADAAAIRIPVRSHVATARWPAVVSVTVDDRLAAQVTARDREWRALRVRLPSPGSRQFRRIDLRVDRTEGGTRGLQVGRIEVTPRRADDPLDSVGTRAGDGPSMAGMRCACRAVGVLAGFVLAAGCVVHVDTEGQIVREEKRFAIPGTPDLRLVTFDGAIDVQSWDDRDVLVEIEKRGPSKEAVDALEIVTTQEGSRIDLEVRRPRTESFSGIGLYRTASARLIVSVPRETNLRARSGDGSIRVERLNGRIELRTGDGSIRARDVAGELTMNTGDGSVTVSGAEGRLEVDTGDGRVNVSGRFSRVRLHTGDGSIVYRAESESRMTADWEITTGDGGITVYLPEGFSADLDAHTGDGRVRSDIWIAPTHEGERRRTLRGRLGEGGRTLRIRTGDGAIRLRPS